MAMKLQIFTIKNPKVESNGTCLGEIAWTLLSKKMRIVICKCL